MIVLDASVCGPWFLPDEASDISDRAAEELRMGKVVAPALWPFEIRNILLMASRRKRIARDELDRVLTKLSTVTLQIDAEPVWARVAEHAVAGNLTIYDAAYLELAERRQLALATLDRRLAEAARAAGVQILF